MSTAVAESVLEPLVVLLRSRDPHVQKAASLAMSNFALNGPGKVLQPLMRVSLRSLHPHYVFNFYSTMQLSLITLLVPCRGEQVYHHGLRSYKASCTASL